MAGDLALEGELAGVAALHFHEHLLVFVAEALHDGGRDEDLKLGFAGVALEAAHDSGNLALDVDGDGEGALDDAVALAVGAIDVHLGEEALFLALAGHLHEAELGDGEDVGAGAVAAEGGLHGLVNLVLVLAALHVDEVDDDESADVAQAHLAGDLFDGLGVDLEDGLFLGAGAAVAAGVDVDGDEGLGLVDDEVAAALEVDLAAEGGLHLGLDAVVIEDGEVAFVELDDAAGAAGDAAGDLADAGVGGLVVDGHAVDVFGEPVADDALDEVGLGVDAGGGAHGLDVVLELAPDVEDVAEVAAEGALVGAGADGTDDDADAGGQGETIEDLLEAEALLAVGNLAGDAAGGLGRGHHDEVAAGEGEVRGDAGALGADGALGDLDNDVAAGGEALLNLFVGDAAAAGLAPTLLFIEEAALIGKHVPVVKEGVLFETDIDEGGLEVVLQILDAALEDAPDEALLHGVLHLEFLNAAVFHNGHAGLQLFHVHHNLALLRLPLK